VKRGRSGPDEGPLKRAARERHRQKEGASGRVRDTKEEKRRQRGRRRGAAPEGRALLWHPGKRGNRKKVGDRVRSLDPAVKEGGVDPTGITRARSGRPCISVREGGGRTAVRKEEAW